ncbi:unnamed protein product [Oreochromis niloticus]|nr:unnamed protein product [Mustela putorius furo]
MLQTAAGPSNVQIRGPGFLTTGVASNFTCSAECYPSCNYTWRVDFDGVTFSTIEGNPVSIVPPPSTLSGSLTCKAKNSLSHLYISTTLPLQVAYGPASVVMNGVDVVTLGILYSFQCSASCYPACQFTWTWGNVTSQGPELSLQLTQLQANQNLTCTAVNPVTKTAATAQKMLQTAAGPSNVQIRGPGFLTTGVASNFTCSAECYPSCNYTWRVDFDGVTFSTVEGNPVSIVPPPSTLSGSLTCKAKNSLSHLYISTTLPLQVASANRSLATRPEETSAVLLLAFIIPASFTL